MKRRDVLMAAGGVVSAGCLGDGGGNDDTEAETRTDSTTERTATERTTTDAGTTAQPTTGAETTTAPVSADTATATATDPAPATGTPDGTPSEPIPIPDAPTDARKGGLPTDEARVRFANDGARVVVTGTITGRNGCRTAVLESTRRTDSELVVTVGTERDAATDAACSMALVDLGYRFTVDVERPPTSVAVVHRGAAGERTVTTADRG